MSTDNLPALTHSPQDIELMARNVAKSGLFPGIKTPEQASALMLLCQAEGLHPMQAVKLYHIIENRPSMKAEVMLARHLATGGKVQWHQRDEKCASATFSHPSGGEITVTWDQKTATEAQLWDRAMWKKYRRAMLHARCVSEGIRAVNPGVLLGLYTPEEVQDMGEDDRDARAPRTIETTAVEVKPGRPAKPAVATAAQAAPRPSQTLAEAVAAYVAAREPADPARFTEAILAGIAERAVKRKMMTEKEAADPDCRGRALEDLWQQTPKAIRATITDVGNQTTAGLLPEPAGAIDGDDAIDVDPIDDAGDIDAPDDPPAVPMTRRADYHLEFRDGDDGPMLYIPDDLGDSYELTGPDVLWFRDQLERTGRDVTAVWRLSLRNNGLTGEPRQWPTDAVAAVYTDLVRAAAHAPTGAA